MQASQQRRKTYEQQSVIMWINKGETFAEAKARLDQAWKDGRHPAQVLSRSQR